MSFRNDYFDSRNVDLREPRAPPLNFPATNTLPQPSNFFQNRRDAYRASLRSEANENTISTQRALNIISDRFRPLENDMANVLDYVRHLEHANDDLTYRLAEV